MCLLFWFLADLFQHMAQSGTTIYMYSTNIFCLFIFGRFVPTHGASRHDDLHVLNQYILFTYLFLADLFQHGAIRHDDLHVLNQILFFCIFILALHVFNINKHLSFHVFIIWYYALGSHMVILTKLLNPLLMYQTNKFVIAYRLMLLTKFHPV